MLIKASDILGSEVFGKICVYGQVYVKDFGEARLEGEPGLLGLDVVWIHLLSKAISRVSQWTGIERMCPSRSSLNVLHSLS